MIYNDIYISIKHKYQNNLFLKCQNVMIIPVYCLLLMALYKKCTFSMVTSCHSKPNISLNKCCIPKRFGQLSHMTLIFQKNIANKNKYEYSQKIRCANLKIVHLYCVSLTINRIFFTIYSINIYLFTFLTPEIGTTSGSGVIDEFCSPKYIDI